MSTRNYVEDLEYVDAKGLDTTSPASMLTAGFLRPLVAATTAAGFLSLTLSRIPAIREFGFFCTVGVVACVITALVFVPAVQSLIRAPRARPEPSKGGLERWAARVA